MIVVEDVPEEPEVEPEPEELKEPSVQNTEPEQHQETSTQDLEPEPAQEPGHTATPVLPDPGLVTDSEGAVPQADDLDLPDGGSGQKKQVEEEEEEGGTAPDPDPVKEENICEHQEDLSSQQVQTPSCSQ